MTVADSNTRIKCSYCGWSEYKDHARSWRIRNERPYCPYCATILFSAPPEVLHMYPHDKATKKEAKL